MKLATWNVNSINARKERLLAWLDKNGPDVLCLQETKVLDDAFPRGELEARGYQAAIYGQRTYNGVAILARQPLEDVRIGLGDDADDPQARLIFARVSGLSVISVYVPNGDTRESDKFRYKLSFLDRLRVYLERHHTPGEPLVVCGDYNIAPEDRDCHDPEAWRDSVLFHESVRPPFQRLLDWGLVDLYRLHVADAGKFSWWDYRMLAFPKGRGLRIDHILATRSVAERCTAANIDRNERKGKQPSDHAPVIAEISW